MLAIASLLAGFPTLVNGDGAGKLVGTATGAAGEHGSGVVGALNVPSVLVVAVVRICADESSRGGDEEESEELHCKRVGLTADCRNGDGAAENKLE